MRRLESVASWTINMGSFCYLVCFSLVISYVIYWFIYNATGLFSGLFELIKPENNQSEISNLSHVLFSDNKHCECINNNCGCCTYLKYKAIDVKLCANFTYLPKDYGVSVTITYNNKAIINETVSARNPIPICFEICEDLPIYLCLHFYDLNIDKDKKCFSGCAEFQIRFFHIIDTEHLTLGCFGCKTELTLKSLFTNMLSYYNYTSEVQ